AHAVGDRRAVQHVVQGIRDGQDDHRSKQELEKPERRGQIGLRQREREASEEAGERRRPLHQITVKKSIRFCTQNTLREVQRAAARGSASVRRPLLVLSRSSRIFSSGSTTASVRWGPRETEKRVHRASPSQWARYGFVPSKRSSMSTGMATSPLR